MYLVYPMLPVSLDCQFLIAPSVFSNVYIERGIHVSTLLQYTFLSLVLFFLIPRCTIFRISRCTWLWKFS